jgi:hypothetical protein
MNYREDQREGRVVYVFDDGRYFYRRDKADMHAAKLNGTAGVSVDPTWSEDAGAAIARARTVGMAPTRPFHVESLELHLPLGTPLTATPRLTLADQVLPLPPVWCWERSVQADQIVASYVFTAQARADLLTFQGEPQISVAVYGVLSAKANIGMVEDAALPTGQPDHAEA